MTRNGVSQEQLYKAINEFRKENNERFDKMEEMFTSFHREEFMPLVEWKNDLKGRLVIIGGLFMVGINVIVEFVKRVFIKE